MQIKNSSFPVRSSSLPVRSTCHMHVSVAVPKLYSCFFLSKTLLLHVNHSHLVTFSDVIKASSPYLAILHMFTFKVKLRVVLWKYSKYLFDNIYSFNKLVRISTNIFLNLIKVPKLILLIIYKFPHVLYYYVQHYVQHRFFFKDYISYLHKRRCGNTF